MNVLLVDDNEWIRSGIKLLFAPEAWINIIGECSNGKEAIAFLEENDTIDLILMDVSMPIMDGIQATRHIKRNKSSIKIIMLSMHDEDNYISASREAGADAYIRKDSDPAEIIQKIREICSL